MGHLASTLFLLVAAPVLAMDSATIPPATSEACAVTLAAKERFAEPSPSSPRRFWYGDENLAVLLKSGGSWRGMGAAHRYRDKLFWWRKGYDGRNESRPSLTVRGRRLDAPAPPADVSRATNAYHSDFGGWAMLVGVEFPTSGCWELTGQYRGSLSFVVQVGP